MRHGKFLAVPVAAAVALCSVALAGCSNNTDLYYYMYAMDTWGTICVSGDFSTEEKEDAAYDFCRTAEAEVLAIEDSISASVETSFVNAFNEAEPGDTVEIDEITYDVLSFAMDAYEATDGAYNPGVYYSADLYGFAPRLTKDSMPYDRDDSLPDEEYVNAFRELSEAFADIEICKKIGGYYAVKPLKTVEVEGTEYSLKIDLGGIGKGYATKVVYDMFGEYGYDYGSFVFGSSSIAVKKCASEKDGEWYLDFTDPRGYGTYLESKINDVCLSSSGDYEQYFEYEGTRYCHVIDPATGSPVQTGIIACTIIGGDAALIDAYTTAIMAMGLESAVDFINANLKDSKVVFVYEGANGYFVICNDPVYFTITNPAYSLGCTVDADGNIVLETYVD
ncbi:MAG: FAD:protein FMN transferase [Clostridia bacterium]|nr:FAD:protein FMN transferase [Clostridia bacterium]